MSENQFKFSIKKNAIPIKDGILSLSPSLLGNPDNYQEGWGFLFYKLFISLTNFCIELFASPNNMRVLSLKNRKFSIPA